MPWMDGMNGWMDGSRDEKSFTKNNHNVFYHMKYWSSEFNLLALPTRARIFIVFRFIIEYSSLRDFGP